VTKVSEPETAIPTGDRWQTDLASIDLRFGAGRLAELGATAREIGARGVLLVSDRGLRAAGHVSRAEQSLAAAGLDFLTFDNVLQNPDSELISAAAAFASGRDIDLIVGMGGGSAMDCAKGINFLLTNGGRMEDYWGYDKAERELLPSIGVPTTAGTGSDAQSYAVVSQAGYGRKMACGAPGAAFRVVILDPELVLSKPHETVAAAGIDAVSHALESHVTRKRSTGSAVLSAEAWQLLDANFPACFDEAADQLACRGQMLIGAHLAGAAIEASMLGATHACANPLTARFQVVHGIAVGLMLPHVIRFNAQVAAEHYRELEPAGAEALALRVESLRRTAGLPASLRECGVTRDSLPELAELASHEWTGGFNPRPAEASDFLHLYEAAY
jgi:alcohol dehydrogenase